MRIYGKGSTVTGLSKLQYLGRLKMKEEGSQKTFVYVKSDRSLIDSQQHKVLVSTRHSQYPPNCPPTAAEGRALASGPTHPIRRIAMPASSCRASDAAWKQGAASQGHWGDSAFARADCLWCPVCTSSPPASRTVSERPSDALKQDNVQGVLSSLC